MKPEMLFRRSQGWFTCSPTRPPRLGGPAAARRAELLLDSCIIQAYRHVAI
jgi:hypothetical protein